MTATKVNLNTHQVITRLRERYKAPEYAFFTEVADSTGGGRRRADAIAMGLWPSRGMCITGFEVKVSRSDWLCELRNPAKAEPVSRYCDFWFVVIGDPTIVRDGELPPNWGLIGPHGSHLKIIKEAPRTDTQPIDRNFLASLLRCSHQGAAHVQEIAAAREAARSQGYQRGKEEGKQEANWKFPRVEKELTELKAKITEFEEISGVDVCAKSWESRNVANVAGALKLLLGGGLDFQLDRIIAAKNIASEILQLIDGYESWKAAAPPLRNAEK